MKKTLFVMMAAAGLMCASCGGNGNTNAENNDSTAVAAEETPALGYESEKWKSEPTAPAGYEATVTEIDDRSMKVELAKGDKKTEVSVSVMWGTIEKMKESSSEPSEWVNQVIQDVEIGDGAFIYYQTSKDDGSRHTDYWVYAAKGEDILKAYIKADVESEDGKAALEFFKSFVETYVKK